MMPVSKKIYNIYNNLLDLPYKGDIAQCHFSVAITKGKIISPVSYNYCRTMVLGEMKGTIHAEMSTINNILNSFPDFVYRNYKQCILWG